MMGFGFSTGFGLMSVIMPLFFLVFICVFVVILIKGLSQWNKNNHSPRLTVEATVVAKRTNVTHHHHGNVGDVGHHTSTDTSYYVTFQVASGDRMEFHLSGSEYGMLIEGDRGNLSFQGTRYLGFERM